MMEKYKRNHLLTVIDDFIFRLIKVIIPLFILFAGRLKEKDNIWGGLIAWAFLSAIILFMALASLLKWYKNVYYINDKFIVFRSGVFVVQRREIPFNKIQTINISQNIIQRVFNLAEMKIDTGNSSINKSEISIKTKKVDAEQIRSIILDSKNKDEAAGKSVEVPEGKIQGSSNDASGSEHYAVTSKDLLIAGLTSNAVLTGFAFLASIVGLFNDYMSSVIEGSLDNLERYIGAVDFSTMPLSRMIMFIGILILIFLLFSFILSLLGTYIKYFGFTVKRENKNITISYGLLDKKSYIIPIAKIKAVYMRQNLLRQVMGLYAIHVESIGYGNEKGEEALLFPIAGAGRKREIIFELLPEYLFDEELTRVDKSTLRRFVISSAMVPLLLCIILTVSFSFGWLSFLLLPVFVLKGFLEYRNTAIGVHNRLLCMNNGAFTKSTSLMTISDIQSTTDRSNFMQRRRGLFHFMISIQSNVFGRTITVRYLDAALKEILMGLI